MHVPVAIRLLLPMALMVAPHLFAGGDLRAQAGARERTIVVSAVDRSGTPLELLTAADLVIREDKARREVLRVSRAIEPIDIALLVDTSAASTALIPPMREGLTRFVALMTAPEGPRHTIALIGVGARPTVIVDYTSDRQALQRGIGRLFDDSTSGMYLLDALVEVSRGLERRETARAVVVPVITDGIEYSNKHYADVIASMTRAGTAMHAVTVGTFDVSTDDAIRNRSLVLDQGAAATGGQWVRLLTPSAVTGALERLARELSSQHKVVYGRPESLIPPERVEVTSSRPGVTVRAIPLRGQNSGA